ncbi:6-phosphogluconolactonase [Amylibacter kogurei]|uniref:6-phosphogluconolactonase n=1 Tax=Paramylibacter kogurei TaxID=1889778 RepID=A0A2G5K5P8_9RHOB|nr:6-phosphogluconolactonase [Amylibacter kogurei]PIB24866.1 6-phosphogluconolactonase [Amylibacter kogurei]
MTKPFHTFENRAALMQGLADRVASELADALATNGRAVLAVPGGSTPAPFFDALNRADLDWANVTVMLTDERFVPETSDRSNTTLIKQRLLQNNALAARFVPFYQPADRPEDVLGDIIGDVAAAMPLDVCVLGMGADMHTASIFPEADLLDEALDDNAPILLPMRAPGAPEPRITLTAPALKSAKNIHVLIAGAEKKAAYSDALREQPLALSPIRVILSDDVNTDIFYAD